MSRLWTPPKVSRELRAGTDQYRADLLAQLSFQNVVSAAWNPELQKIDPYLRLAKAHETADMAGLRPGFYHLVRLNPGAPPWVQPLTGPDGSFAEPTLRMLEELRASDLQSARANRERDRRRREAELAEESRKQREKEARIDELAERWRAARETQVSMDRSVPWTQTAKARRER